MKASDYFERAFDMSLKDDIASIINTQSSLAYFEKGVTISNVGEQATAMYLIISGIVRGYYLNEDGKDVTKCFSAEAELFSTEGFRLSAPTTFAIECIVDCHCLKIPYVLLNHLIELDRSIEELIRKLFQDEVGKQEMKNRSFLLQSAEERYLEFNKQYSSLVMRVPQKYIASYLGIAPQSLSRIKKRIET